MDDIFEDVKSLTLRFQSGRLKEEDFWKIIRNIFIADKNNLISSASNMVLGSSWPPCTLLLNSIQQHMTQDYVVGLVLMLNFQIGSIQDSISQCFLTTTVEVLKLIDFRLCRRAHSESMLNFICFSLCIV